MKVLKIEPKKYPEVVEIDSSLESLQKEVGGPIQAVYPWDDLVALICNEEGKLRGLELNRELIADDGEPIDVIAGTFLIVGLTEDDFGDLPQELIDKFDGIFHQPKEFRIVHGKCGNTLIGIHPYTPENGAK